MCPIYLCIRPHAGVLEGLKLTKGLPQYQDLTFCVHPPKLDLRPPRGNMESWLIDVKRVRIPRPKFGSGNRCYVYPTEPPKDYIYDDGRSDELKLKASIQTANLAKATEELRRALQEKL